MMDNTKLPITCHRMFANARGANIFSGASNKTYYCSTGRNMTSACRTEGIFIVMPDSEV